MFHVCLGRFRYNEVLSPKQYNNQDAELAMGTKGSYW